MLCWLMLCSYGRAQRLPLTFCPNNPTTFTPWCYHFVLSRHAEVIISKPEVSAHIACYVGWSFARMGERKNWPALFRPENAHSVTPWYFHFVLSRHAEMIISKAEVLAKSERYLGWSFARMGELKNGGCLFRPKNSSTFTTRNRS